MKRVGKCAATLLYFEIYEESSRALRVFGVNEERGLSVRVWVVRVVFPSKVMVGGMVRGSSVSVWVVRVVFSVFERVFTRVLEAAVGIDVDSWEISSKVMVGGVVRRSRIESSVEGCFSGVSKPSFPIDLIATS